MSRQDICLLCDEITDVVAKLRMSVLFQTETSVTLDRFWRLQDQTYQLVGHIRETAGFSADLSGRIKTLLDSIVEVLRAAEKIPARRLAAVGRAYVKINQSLREMEQLMDGGTRLRALAAASTG